MYGILNSLFGAAPALLAGPASLDEADPPLAPDALMDALVAVLRKAGWAAHARVVRVEDAEFGTELPHNSTRYDVEGSMSLNELAAYKAWTPDQVNDALQEAAKRPTDSVFCLLELDTAPGSGDPVVFVKGEEKRLLSLAGPEGLVLVPFSQWNPSTSAAVLKAKELLPRMPAGVRAWRLCMDNSAPLADARDETLPTTWAGPGGWNSAIGKALAIDDVSPCCYLLSKDGRLLQAGDVATVLGSNPDSDDEDEEGRGAPPVLKSRVHRIINEALPRMDRIGRAQGTRGLTVLLRTRTASDGTVSRRLFVAGYIFPEAEAAFEEFGEWLDANIPKIGWLGCRHVTRPAPAVPATACSACKATLVKHVCLCCPRLGSTDVSLCNQCAATHPSNHALLVLGVGDPSKAIFGRGHVLWFEDDSSADELHPGILCDACKGPVLSLRYKNLSEENHDLCAPCFALLCELGPLSDSATFERQFGCRQSDAFAQIKNSRGLEISRDRNLTMMAHQRDSHGGDDEDEGEDGAPGHVRVPRGHTTYSWWPSGEKVGMGHTVYSWGGEY